MDQNISFRAVEILRPHQGGGWEVVGVMPWSE
jgi:hypothetical protein